MADRYWVGGTGTWGSSQTTNWSAATGLSFTASCTGTTLTTVGSPALVAGMTVFSSTHVSLGTIVSGSVNTWVVTIGGTYGSQSMSAATVGASVPTAADNVFFDANSNSGTTAFTCTMANTPRVCNNFTASGLDGTMTLAGTSIALNVSGSLTFQATNFTRTYTGVTTFNATTTGKTITTNGVAFGAAVTFDGVGGGWTLGSALTISASSTSLTVTNGTFDTSSVGNYAVTVPQLFSSNSNIRTINLNASTVTLSGISAISFATPTNLTFNAGTSQINFTSSSHLDDMGGQTFYNVSHAQVSGFVQISSTATYNNLTFASRTSVGLGRFTYSDNQTINGIFTIGAGTTASCRYFINSSIISVPRTFTCASIAAMSDVDFRDITIAGAHGTLSGTRLGNCKGNTNITFPAAKTVYYRQTGSADWGTTGSGSWSATSGGALDATMFPLAQDTAVFPAATYPASGSTTTINGEYNVGTIDMSLRTTNTMTLASAANTLSIYANFITGTGITLTSTTAYQFSGRTTQQITSAGKTFPAGMFISSPGGTVILQDVFTTGSTVTTTLSRGTLDLNNFKLTTGLFTCTSPGTNPTRAIAFGTGSIDCTGTGSVWLCGTATGLTTTGTQVVNVTSVGSTAITVTPGAMAEIDSISFNFTGGTYPLAFLPNSGNAAKNVNFTGYAGTLAAMSSGVIYGNLTLSSGMTLTASIQTLSFRATSGTKTITTNAKTLDFPVTFNGTGGTWQLQDALTIGATRLTTLTLGTLDLNNLTLSTGNFFGSGAGTRAIAFGTGNITCTGTGTVWTTATATALTTTGTQVVNVTSTGSTSIIVNTGTLSETDSISFNFTGGTYSLQFLSTFGDTARNVNFTGYAGTLFTTGNSTIFGNLTLSSGMTLSASGNPILFGATSGTKTITTNAKTLDFPVNFNCPGATYQIQDAITFGSTRNTTFTAGTVDFNGLTWTTGTASSQGNAARNLTFNGGSLIIVGSGSTAWNVTGGSGFTTTAGTGVGTISMTAATAKTFVGGGYTYNCTVNQGGAGALSIEGSNTFSNITNTVQPASILFTAGTTSTFSNFSLSGTAGNLITIGSITAASHTLSKASGTVSVSFCSISRSNATGGADWEAFTAAPYLNTNGGNNTGWDFGSTGNFLAFFL